jgi:hypothetical protein
LILIDDLGCYFISDGFIYRSGCFSFKDGSKPSINELKRFTKTKIRLKENPVDEQKTKKPIFKPNIKIPKTKTRSWL